MYCIEIPTKCRFYPRETLRHLVTQTSEIYLLSLTQSSDLGPEGLPLPGI